MPYDDRDRSPASSVLDVAGPPGLPGLPHQDFQLMRPISTAILLTTLATPSSAADPAPPSYDVVVYGGTSGAITAAVQAKRQGRTVVLVSPDKHLGGLTSG